MKRKNKHCKEIVNKNYGSTNLIKLTFAIFAIAFMAIAFFAMPAAATEINLIANQGFENGISPWAFYTDGTGKFLNDASGQRSLHAGHITISQQGTNVQLYQAGIALEPNTEYSLYFKAYSSTGHDLAVSMQKHGFPYTNYGLSKYAVNLGTGWGSYSIIFKTSGFSGNVNNARLMFWLAPYDAAGDQYYFDDVILSKVSSVTPTPAPTSTPFPQVNPTPTPTPTSDIVSNPGFESGTSPWAFYTNGAGKFLNDVSGQGSLHAGHIMISQPGTNVQLYQAGLALEPNTEYSLSFKAYSSAGHNLEVSMQKHGSPYTNYGLSKYPVNLGTGWGSYSIRFKTSGFSVKVNDARLIFWLAPYDAAGDQYYFDDVILSKVSSVTPTPAPTSAPLPQVNPTPTPTPSPTPKSTLLFDGSFNMGTPGTPLTSNQCPQNNFITPWKYCLQPPSKVTISDLYRNGERAALFSILAANPDTNGIDRSEILINKGVTNLGGEGDDLYYGWSMLFPSSWTVPQSWELVFQMKGYNRVARNPAISFNIESDNKMKVLRCTGNFGSSTSLCPTGLVSYPTPILNINDVKGKWVDYVMRVRFAVDNSGIMEVWYKIDGQSSYTKSVDWQNIPTLQYDPVADTKNIDLLLMGPYRGHESNTQQLYATGVKIGITRSDVES